MAYEQFLPLLFFISFERNFRLKLISVSTDKILREVPYTPPSCWPTGGKDQIPNSWVLMFAKAFLHQRDIASHAEQHWEQGLAPRCPLSCTAIAVSFSLALFLAL